MTDRQRRRPTTDRVALDEASDADLVAAHRAGDPDAFGVLFARHRDRLWAVALRSTGDREDAADALQEAMISAFTRVDGYRGEAAVTTWLHRVVVNACLDRLRRNRVRSAQPLPDDIDEGVRRGGLVASGDQHGDPEPAALRGDRRRALLAALSELSAEQRTALVLVDMEGYPVEEVARMLACPAGTVKSRCARGRARLAVLLGMTAEGTNRDAGASHRGPTGPQPAPGRSSATGAATPTPEGGTLR